MTALRRSLYPVALALLLLAALPAGAAPSPFDGAWEITLACPPLNDDDDDAKGYTHVFTGVIQGGELRATYGTEGEPGWHLLTGTIGAEGAAELKFDGVVKNEAYAINHAGRGKPYTYKVRAKFQATSGDGVRVGKRKCLFAFKRT